MISPKILEIERSILALSIEEQKLLLSRLTQQIKETGEESEKIEPFTKEEVKKAQEIIQKGMIEAMNTPEGTYQTVWAEFDAARSRIISNSESSGD